MIRRGGYKPAPGARRAQHKEQDWRAEVAFEQTHAQLVLDIMKYLQLTGWYVLVTPRGGIPGMAGFPDLAAFKGRRTLFIEAKVGGDQQSVDQVRVAEELASRDFEVLEATSLEQVIAAAGRGA